MILKCTTYILECRTSEHFLSSGYLDSWLQYLRFKARAHPIKIIKRKAAIFQNKKLPKFTCKIQERTFHSWIFKKILKLARWNSDQTENKIAEIFFCKIVGIKKLVSILDFRKNQNTRGCQLHFDLLPCFYSLLPETWTHIARKE